MATAAFEFNAERHEYTQNGVVIPSVSQVLKLAGLADYSHIDPAVLARKAAIGTEVHRAAQMLDEGARLTDLDLDPAVLPYVEAFEQFRANEKYEPILIEHATVAQFHGMKYGMTLDRVCGLNGAVTLLDIKCACATQTHWGVQLAGYHAGYRINAAAEDIENRVILHLKPQNKNKKYAILDGHNSRLRGFRSYGDELYNAAWLAALTLTNFKLSQGEELPDATTEEGDE
jgi:hypothetical protein